MNILSIVIWLCGYGHYFTLFMNKHSIPVYKNFYLHQLCTYRSQVRTLSNKCEFPLHNVTPCCNNIIWSSPWDVMNVGNRCAQCQSWELTLDILTKLLEIFLIFLINITIHEQHCIPIIFFCDNDILYETKHKSPSPYSLSLRVTNTK